MSTERIPPTPAQRRLVNIGMLIQFHLAAIGHLVVWVWMFYDLLYNPLPYGPDDEGYIFVMIQETFVYRGIPFSFGVLIAVYIFFRCLIAYANFGTALKIMISITAFQAILMGVIGVGTGVIFFRIVPLRLAIPIMLYSIACYFYHTTQLQARIQARENG